jgi:hypothetical protein
MNDFGVKLLVLSVLSLVAGCSQQFKCNMWGQGCPNSPVQSSGAAPPGGGEASGEAAPAEDCLKPGANTDSENKCCSRQSGWPEDQMSYYTASQKGMLTCK